VTGPGRWRAAAFTPDRTAPVFTSRDREGGDLHEVDLPAELS
jgi:hypothetical protein